MLRKLIRRWHEQTVKEAHDNWYAAETAWLAYPTDDRFSIERVRDKYEKYQYLANKYGDVDSEAGAS